MDEESSVQRSGEWKVNLCHAYYKKTKEIFVSYSDMWFCILCDSLAHSHLLRVFLFLGQEFTLLHQYYLLIVNQFWFILHYTERYRETKNVAGGQNEKQCETKTTYLALLGKFVCVMLSSYLCKNYFNWQNDKITFRVW